MTVTKTVTARERQTATVRFTFEVEEEPNSGAFEPLVYTGANCRAYPRIGGMFHSGGIRVDVATLSSLLRAEPADHCSNILTALSISIAESVNICDGRSVFATPTGRGEAFLQSVRTLFAVGDDGPLCYWEYRPGHASTGGWRIPELVRAWQEGSRR